MAKRIEIEISENMKLVAEINHDPYKEIMIGVEKDGCWIQDLAIVGKRYHYDMDLNVTFDDGFQVFVYGDAKTEDYTDEFLIDQYEEEE